jgi:hypothetical protein
VVVKEHRHLSLRMKTGLTLRLWTLVLFLALEIEGRLEVVDKEDHDNGDFLIST